jgi:translation initiation factor eIF-2B subunit epsilon
MGPKQKGAGGSAGGGGGTSRQKGNNATEEVEETLQAVVRDIPLAQSMIADASGTIHRFSRIYLKQDLNLLHLIFLGYVFIYAKRVALTVIKCLLPLANTPLIEYTLEFLANAGVQEVFLYAGAHADQVENYIRYDEDIMITFSRVMLLVSAAS